MARNKYPEETIRLILDTAEKLFLEKGYDDTSLQDIINETRLSKGAIYYHFSSKEDIFVKICDRIGEANAEMFHKILANQNLNGQEKLKEVFRAALLYSDQNHMLSMCPFLLESPKFLAMQIQNLYDDVIPHYIQPILEEGIADGSIRTDHPKELSEAIMILSNVWLHPLIQPTSEEEMKARCEVFSQLMRGVGIDLLDDELTAACSSYCRLLNQNCRRRC